MSDETVRKDAVQAERVRQQDAYFCDGYQSACDDILAALKAVKSLTANIHGPDAQAIIEQWLLAYQRGEVQPGDCQGIMEQLIQAAQPVWSREVPSSPGHYWWRDRDYNHGEPELCHIVNTTHGLHCFFASYDDQECLLVELDSVEWAKIPLPREAPCQK